MKNEIKLLRNNSKRQDSDLEKIDEFYKFLQGELPEGIKLGCKLRLSVKKSMAIIWYLQEHLSILPDTIEQCSICKNLFDTINTGHYSELEEKCYCGACDHLHKFKSE